MSVDIAVTYVANTLQELGFVLYYWVQLAPILLSMFVRSVPNAQSLGIAFLGGVTATILTLFWDNEDSTLAMPYSQTLDTKLVVELV